MNQDHTVSTVGESGKWATNEDQGMLLEASPRSGPDGGVSPSSSEASFRGVASQSGTTNGASFTDEQFVDTDYVCWLKCTTLKHCPPTPNCYPLSLANDDVVTSIVEKCTYQWWWSGHSQTDFILSWCQWQNYHIEIFGLSYNCNLFWSWM